MSWVYKPTYREGGSFMAIDGHHRPAARSELCHEVLTRDQVVNNDALIDLRTRMIDAIWLYDSRVDKVKTLGSDADEQRG